MQEIVALSTTEAEYIATTSAACQVVSFKRILQECGHVINKATRLWCDNQSAIAVAKNPSHHGRTKHINVRYHFINGIVIDEVVSLHHYSTDKKLADMFTKPLPPEKHATLRSLIGMRTLQSRGGIENVIEDRQLADGMEMESQ